MVVFGFERAAPEESVEELAGADGCWWLNMDVEVRLGENVTFSELRSFILGNQSLNQILILYVVKLFLRLGRSDASYEARQGPHREACEPLRDQKDSKERTRGRVYTGFSTRMFVFITKLSDVGCLRRREM